MDIRPRHLAWNSTSPTANTSSTTRISGSRDRKSTRLNSSHLVISYAVFCLKKKTDRLRLPPPYRNPTPPTLTHHLHPSTPQRRRSPRRRSVYARSYLKSPDHMLRRCRAHR